MILKIHLPRKLITIITRIKIFHKIYIILQKENFSIYLLINNL